MLIDIELNQFLNLRIINFDCNLNYGIFEAISIIQSRIQPKNLRKLEINLRRTNDTTENISMINNDIFALPKKIIVSFGNNYKKKNLI